MSLTARRRTFPACLPLALTALAFAGTWSALPLEAADQPAEWAPTGDPSMHAGPELLASGGDAPGRWNLVNGANGGAEQGEAAALGLRMPEYRADPDTFEWEETAPAARLTFEPGLDLRPWDILAIEASNPGEEHPATFGVRLQGAKGKPVFMFHSAPPAGRTRFAVHLGWADPHFKPAAVQWLLLHKSYPAEDDAVRFTRVRPAHRAVTGLWDAQDRLADEGATRMEASRRSELTAQAAEIERRYWAGEMTGAELTAEVEALTAGVDEAALAAVREAAAEHAGKRRRRTS